MEKIKIPGDEYSELINARLWLTTSDKSSYLAIGRIKLLENIEEFGSINQAAKQMQMSYKKAWKLIDEMNSLHKNRPLVVSEKGGKSGGGTALTDLGRLYLAEFRKLEAELIEFLQAKSAGLKARLESDFN